MQTFEKATQPRRVLSNDIYKFQIYKKHVSIYDLASSKFVCAIDVRSVRRIINALDNVNDESS